MTAGSMRPRGARRSARGGSPFARGAGRSAAAALVGNFRGGVAPRDVDNGEGTPYRSRAGASAGGTHRRPRLTSRASAFVFVRVVLRLVRTVIPVAPASVDTSPLQRGRDVRCRPSIGLRMPVR